MNILVIPNKPGELSVCGKNNLGLFSLSIQFIGKYVYITVQENENIVPIINNIISFSFFFSK
ncbi:MAG: hypothetical protein IPI52_06215 [Bacteroidetes bacterium]|nr:hypothetical protein [Bacteroidota bacterium]